MLISLTHHNNYDLEIVDSLIKNKNKNFVKTCKSLRKFSSRLAIYIPRFNFKYSYTNFNELAFSALIAYNHNNGYSTSNKINLDYKYKKNDIKKCLNIYNSFTKQNLNMRKFDNIVELTQFLYEVDFKCDDNIIEVAKKACLQRIDKIQKYALDRTSVIDMERPKVDFNITDLYIKHLDSNKKIIELCLEIGRRYDNLIYNQSHLFYVNYKNDICILSIHPQYNLLGIEYGLINGPAYKYGKKILSKVFKPQASGLPF